MSKPLVLVCGGTGLQGGGCLGDLEASGACRLRTFTRSLKSKAAQALIARGIDVREGDMRDRAFVSSVMHGVDILFAATFSDHDGTEVQQGQNLGDAAVDAKVRLVVFSGGESIGVDAMDNKWKIEQYLRTLPLEHLVVIHTAFFFENVATKRGTKRVKVDRARRTYCFSIPLLRDMRIPFIAPHDIGRFAAAVILRPNKFPHGSVARIAGDVISPQEYVDTFARLTGKQATYEQFSLDFFRRLPIPGAELIVQMYEWYHAGCPGEGHTRDPAATRALCPHVRNLEEWLRTDGLPLIEKMAYTETIWTRLGDAFTWALLHVFGAYLKTKRLLLGK